MKRSLTLKLSKLKSKTADYGQDMAQPNLAYSIREIIDRTMQGKPIALKQYQSLNDDPELKEDVALSQRVFEDNFEAYDYIKNIDSFKKRLRMLNQKEEQFKKEAESKKEKAIEEEKEKHKKMTQTKEENEPNE